MARVPCAPVPDTGRQGILKYVILLPWHAKPRNPTEVVHVWTTIQSKFRCCPHPPFRPGLADQTGSPLASRDMRAAVMLHKVQAERLHGKPYQTYPRIRVRLQHSSGSPVPRPAAVMAALSPRPRVPASKICGFPALDPGSCASLLALIFLTCPEQDQLLRQRGPMSLSTPTPPSVLHGRHRKLTTYLGTNQNTICI